MSTTGQFSTKNPTIKRILKEAAELASTPSPDYHATPLDSDLFTWHFTLRGPPSSVFASGIYHGSITLPPSYPLKPPNFRFLTPSGRFETNREICLSISGHHEESWQPAWGIRTALVAIRSFMESEAGGQVGGMSADGGVRVRLARESRAWRCGACGKTNEEVLAEQEGLCKEGGEEERVRREKENEMAREIGFVPKGEQKVEDGTETVEASAAASGTEARDGEAQQVQQQSIPVPALTSTPTQPVATRTQPPLQQQHRPLPQVSRGVWLDRAIVGLIGALVIMVLRQFA